jgi:FdhD protein
MPNEQVKNIMISRIAGQELKITDDNVAIEEPLEIQLQYSTATGRMKKNIAVTMRTPGNDIELAAGFLLTEGIVQGMDDIETVHAPNENTVLVTLKENLLPALYNSERNFYSSSSCGICGKASIEAIRVDPSFGKKLADPQTTFEIIYGLPSTLRSMQTVFENTGGIHASGLFDMDGNCIMIREDIGRHNALDKLIGAMFLKQQLPLDNHLLLLSGRASFELIQKAAMAGIRMVIAVGAPSSLAVELAIEHDMTLAGFLRDRKFNIYCGEQRINS